MARPLRIEYPGAYYHILNRGNAGENVFPGREDKERFLDLLAKAAKQFGIGVHAYCVMNNHYHLLIQTSDANLSSAMQWLNLSYAVSYNRRQDRRGHVFGGRFKGLLVDAERYLTHLSRYIHLTPVRAKMVKRPQADSTDISFRTRRCERDIPQLKELRPRVSPEEIIRTVCREFDCGQKQILTKGRKRNTARDIAIWLSRDHTGRSCRDLGTTFGGISGSAISERCKEVRNVLEKDKGLTKRVERVEKRILET